MNTTEQKINQQDEHQSTQDTIYKLRIAPNFAERRKIIENLPKNEIIEMRKYIEYVNKKYASVVKRLDYAICYRNKLLDIIKSILDNDSEINSKKRKREDTPIPPDNSKKSKYDILTAKDIIEKYGGNAVSPINYEIIDCFLKRKKLPVSIPNNASGVKILLSQENTPDQTIPNSTTIKKYFIELRFNPYSFSISRSCNTIKSSTYRPVYMANADNDVANAANDVANAANDIANAAQVLAGLKSHSKN